MLELKFTSVLAGTKDIREFEIKYSASPDEGTDVASNTLKQDNWIKALRDCKDISPPFSQSEIV